MSEHLHNSGLTVADLLRTTALDRGTLRAGHDGTGRIVRRVQWMEVLDDFSNYLAAGDLLLTTAYNLRDDRSLQRVAGPADARVGRGGDGGEVRLPPGHDPLSSAAPG